MKAMPFGMSMLPTTLPLESRRTQVSRVGVLIIVVCLARRLLRFAVAFFAIVYALSPRGEAIIVEAEHESELLALFNVKQMPTSDPFPPTPTPLRSCSWIC
jgi:hypothetical protein